VSLEVRHGEVLAIIGPNGAGRTSLLNSISGLWKNIKNYFDVWPFSY
jgi:branched-chain amino acid transport system ATP-binding protein